MTAKTFLRFVNDEYYRLHYEYESLFWDSYMGNRKVGKKKDRALAALDEFRCNRAHKEVAEALALRAKGKTKDRLLTWVRFFNLYQIPEEGLVLREKINQLETKIQDKRSKIVEGYIDPKSKIFIPASSLKMMTMIATHKDEAIRKACFEAREKLAVVCLSEYVELVSLRNKFAQVLGYSDFYDYKLRHIDNLTKKELFSIFDKITDAYRPKLAAIRNQEKTMRGLRKPWNFSYMINGSFTNEEDQYYPFTEAIPRWLCSFQKMGIDFAGGSLCLDLVERKGKYNNGFCHWPSLVRYEGQKRLPATANFTCNVVPGQVGSGEIAYKTLFHEGGHAAHFLNTTQRDICLNHEYAPMTAAWAETQSMFMDTIFSSYEWKSRYAKNVSGEMYPLDLFIKKTKATNLIQGRDIMSIIFLATFERRVYELEKPSAEKIKRIAKEVYSEVFDHSVDSLRALMVPHIYSWESACSYHGYGLAQIALYQWRDYFYKKYGSIVDNPAIGRELKMAWSWGALYDFKTAVIKATGQKFSPNALIKYFNRTPDEFIREAKRQMGASSNISINDVAVNAAVMMVHGRKVVAKSDAGIGAMSITYKTWYEKMVEKSKLNSKPKSKL